MKMSSTRLGPSLALLGGLAISAQAHAAGTIQIDDVRSVTVGAGLRAGFDMQEFDVPGSEDSTDFDLYSTRLYVSGQVTEVVKFTFNSEAAAGLDVLDAIAQFEFSEGFNIWVGRMLTPADRIEMNGPYYGLSWNQYTVPLFPSDNAVDAGVFGRDEGVTVWGWAGNFQYSFGLFDGVDGGPDEGPTSNPEDNMLFATRLAYNFLDKEMNPGYYTSSTYFGGGGDIFTLGFSYQQQSESFDGPGATFVDFNGWAVDMLFEKPTGGGAAVTIEAEIKQFDNDGCTCGMFDGDSMFVTAAYLLPSSNSVKYQPYVRYTTNEPSNSLPDSDLTELGLNIVIKGHDARLNLGYTTGDANLTGYQGTDTDTINFGVQIQI